MSENAVGEKKNRVCILAHTSSSGNPRTQEGKCHQFSADGIQIANRCSVMCPGSVWKIILVMNVAHVHVIADIV